MSSLVELKRYTNQLSVLYVEDSSALLKQMNIYLTRIFKKVYLASNGVDGLESYKTNKPDLILTDINMPKMDGHEMIKNLKKIDTNIKIIIISAHADTPNLLEAIHAGVSDFVQKPIDNTLLQNALLKVSLEILQKDVVFDKEKLANENDVMKQLLLLKQNNVSIEFVNHYRGVPIINDGNIIHVDDSSITVHVPFIQTLAINYEKKTVFENDMLEYAIEADLLSIDTHTREIKLSNLNKLQFSPKRRKELRVEPSKEFIAVLHYKNKKYNTSIQNISINSVLLTIKSAEFDANENDDVNLSFGFKSHADGANKIEHSEKILCKSNIFKLTRENLKVELVLLFDLAKANELALSRYILQREIELIKEFKAIKDINNDQSK